MFASPYWAVLAVRVLGRRHRLFYQHLAAELAITNCVPLRTMRIFDPLPRDIQEQARWGRSLSDPDWDAPAPPSAIPRTILSHDIPNAYAKNISRLVPVLG